MTRTAVIVLTCEEDEADLASVTIAVQLESLPGDPQGNPMALKSQVLTVANRMLEAAANGAESPKPGKSSHGFLDHLARAWKAQSN